MFLTFFSIIPYRIFLKMFFLPQTPLMVKMLFLLFELASFKKESKEHKASQRKTPGFLWIL